jgi:hypothetical protein
MKKINGFIFLCILIVFSSCKICSTVHPLSENENDLIFKRELLGAWEVDGDKNNECLIDTAVGSGGKSYHIRLKQPSFPEGAPDTSWYEASLVSIGGIYFFDCIADIGREICSGRKEKYSTDLLLNRRFIFKVITVEDNSFTIAAPGIDEVLKLQKQKKISLRYETLGEDDYLFLYKPDILQKKLMELEKYPAVYKDRVSFIRKR